MTRINADPTFEGRLIRQKRLCTIFNATMVHATISNQAMLKVVGFLKESFMRIGPKCSIMDHVVVMLKTQRIIKNQHSYFHLRTDLLNKMMIEEVKIYRDELSNSKDEKD